MSKIEVYCDECRQDLLVNKKAKFITAYTVESWESLLKIKTSNKIT